MATLFSKILIFITVLISLFSPGNVNGAVAEVTNEVKTTDAVIEYTITNETGYVLYGNPWAEKLEYKILGEWVEIDVEDEKIDEEIYVHPDENAAGNYDATILAPGTYRLTVGYNVITSFSGEYETGLSVVEFEVSLN